MMSIRYRVISAMRCFTAFLTREQVVLWRARGYTVVEVVTQWRVG